jgi:ribonuclease D
MLITTSSDLARFCDALRDAPFIAVDTEFVRERTYFARLCLVQVAHGDDAAVIDMLAPKLDIAPLTELLCNTGAVKVLHSASQDMEIFFHTLGQLPAPLFDTQIAASVCGHGEQPGYAALVGALLGVRIDKASQVTDWALRPMTDRQIRYALEDVTHLCRVYSLLVDELEQTGRGPWIAEEVAALLDPARYELRPREVWRRIKLRHANRKALAVLREIAAWREETAIRRNLPSGWVLRDEALTEIAMHAPADVSQLARVRALKPEFARGADGEALLAAVDRALALPEDEWPPLPGGRGQRVDNDSLVALLQALLRLRCDAHGVAMKLVAKRDDLEKIAVGEEPETPVLHGWRREIFGADALELLAGRLALTGNGNDVREVRLSGDAG